MKTILFLVLTTAAFSCQNKNATEALDKEVMSIHDEVMPKMGEIARLKRELRDQLSSATMISENRKAMLEATIVELDSANQAMMNWMHQYSPLPDSAGEEKAKVYLLSEKERITSVKRLMLDAIERAKKVQSDTL